MSSNRGGKFGFLTTARQAPEIDAPPAPSAAQPQTESKRGRPATGKRSDPDYTLVSCYVRKDTHREVQIALLQQEGRQNFSDLVEQLLQQWLKTID